MILERQECEQIHGAALEVLERTGVRVDDPEILSKLQEAGATVTGGNAWRTFHRAWWNGAIQHAPKSVPVADRAGHLWELQSGRRSLVLTGNALYITRGRQRDELKAADLAELARVVDACRNIHEHGGYDGERLPCPVPRFRGVPHHGPQYRQTFAPLCLHSPGRGRLVMEMAQVLSGPRRCASGPS